VRTVGGAQGAPSHDRHTEDLAPDNQESAAAAGRKRTIQELGIQLRNENLTVEQKKTLTDLLEEYSDIFAVDVEDLKNISTPYYHSIHLKDNNAAPIYTKQYRYPEQTKQEIKRQIQAWEKADIIEKSMSMYNNPLVLVNKKSDPANPGKQNFRLCADLRKLNAAIKEITFMLPTFNEILEDLSSKEINYISTCDFKQGYLQIPIEEQSREYLSFEFGYQKYKFKKLPFGLKSSSHVFMNIVTDVLGNKILGDYAACYIGDVIIFSDTFQHHMEHLKAVFDRLRRSGLKMNPVKCN